MPQLYLDEYTRALAGKKVCIACREGILRDNCKDIIADIKFLVRRGALTVLFHNLPHRQANQKLAGLLEKRLPATSLIRISPEVDFYETVLNHPEISAKLIFLERRPLLDRKGNMLNAVTTKRARESLADFGDITANVNFRDVMKRICQKIEEQVCDRVHILPAGKDTIKHELFTVEGSGTLIANNFTEEFRQVQTDEEVAIVHRILTMYKRSGFLKPRSKQYLSKNRHQFYVTAIDGIVVGCVERKEIDNRTVELGALAIAVRFRNQRIGVYTVNSFIQLMLSQGYYRFISLTNNPLLESLYLQLGFIQESHSAYRLRQQQSPNVKMFYKEFAQQ